MIVIVLNLSIVSEIISFFLSEIIWLFDLNLQEAIVLLFDLNPQEACGFWKVDWQGLDLGDSKDQRAHEHQKLYFNQKFWF